MTHETGRRARYPRAGDISDPFISNLASWWQRYDDALPSGKRNLAQPGLPQMMGTQHPRNVVLTRENGRERPNEACYYASL